MIVINTFIKDFCRMKYKLRIFNQILKSTVLIVKSDFQVRWPARP